MYAAFFITSMFSLEQEILDGFTLIRDSLFQEQFEASPGYDLNEDVWEGRLRSISTRHQCITAMKRYRNISFEVTVILFPFCLRPKGNIVVHCSFAAIEVPKFQYG